MGRLDSREFTFGQGKAASAKYYYHDGEADGKAFNKLNGRPSTNLVSKIKYSDKSSLEYEYDKSGNIKEIYTDGELTQRYGYDGTGRLIRDDDSATGLTTLYSYDAGGNILEKKEYACTWDEPSGTPSVKTYTYDAVWKDRLTGYTGYKSTASFKGGNPDSYNGCALCWEKGRQLKSITQPVNPTEVQAWRNVTYEYNANGIRAGKTIDTIEHKYYLLGSKILLETINDGGSVNTLQYLYDNSEEVSGISYNGTEYCYVKNLQGDVIRVIDSNGECVVKYVYNSWGKVIKVTDAQGNAVTSSTHIGNINPIRYRSYYYDPETKYYYLQSRYYDPETGRFLNADSIDYIDPRNINGLNLYSYCGNDPVMFTDPFGTTAWWEWLLAGVIVAGLIVGSIFTGGLLGAAFVGAAIGGGLSLVSQAIDGEISWGQFALNIGVGALTGMLGASGISRAGAMFVGAGIGAVSSIGSQLIGGTSFSDINWWKVGISTAIGGVAGWFGGAGARNATASNAAPKVQKAIGSVNKVLARQNTGYYSAARYAKAALTNVSNRLAAALAKQQLIMFSQAMATYAGGTVATYLSTFWW